METETYIQVDAGGEIAYKVEPIDGHVRITIGPTTGQGSAVHLLLADVDIFRRLAETIMQARDEFVRDVLECRAPKLK